MTLLIGVCGAFIFSELYIHWLKSSGVQTAIYAGLTTLIWFLLGHVTALSHSSVTIPVAAFITLLSVFLTIASRQTADRRFELITLKRILPFFLTYIFLAASWYPLRPLVAWHGMFGFTTRLADTSLQGLYPRLEYLVAFTVLGYLTAEWRGRSELSLKQDLPRLLLVAGGSALLLELLVGFQTGLGASFVRGVIAVLSSLLGGTIYHLLRAHIRFLLGYQQ